MQLAVWLFLGVLGLIVTFGTINQRIDVPTRILAAAFGVVIWGLWAMGATNVETFVETTTYVRNYQSLFVIGLVAAVMHGLFLLRTGLGALQEEIADI